MATHPSSHDGLNRSGEPLHATRQPTPLQRRAPTREPPAISAVHHFVLGTRAPRSVWQRGSATSKRDVPMRQATLRAALRPVATRHQSSALRAQAQARQQDTARVHLTNNSLADSLIRTHSHRHAHTPQAYTPWVRCRLIAATARPAVATVAARLCGSTRGTPCTRVC